MVENQQIKDADLSQSLLLDKWELTWLNPLPLQARLSDNPRYNVLGIIRPKPNFDPAFLKTKSNLQ